MAYTATPLPPVVDAFLLAPGEVQLRWSICADTTPQGFFVEWQDTTARAPDAWYPYAAVPASSAMAYAFNLHDMPPGRFRFRVGMRTALGRSISAPVDVRVSARPPGWVTMLRECTLEGQPQISVGVEYEQTVHLALYNRHQRLAATPAPVRVPPGIATMLPLTLHDLPAGDYTLVVRGEGWQQTIGIAHGLPSPDTASKAC